MTQKSSLFIILMFLFSNRIYCDSIVYHEKEITFFIKMTNLPDVFFLKRIHRVLSFEGDMTTGEYSDFNISYDEYEGESYFILKIKDADWSNKYLFSFFGGYIIVYIKDNEIFDVVYSFY